MAILKTAADRIKFRLTLLAKRLHPKAIIVRLRPDELKKRFKPRQLALTLAISAMCVGLFFMQPYRIGAATQTNSIDCKAFVWKKQIGDDPIDFSHGDYVTFKFLEGDLSPEYYEFFKKLKLVKKVGCAPGSYLECGFGVCRCDGVEIVTSIDEKFAAQAFTHQGQIPPTHVFLIGDNPVSYDGRYWGLTPVRNLVGVVEKCIWWRKE